MRITSRCLLALAMLIGATLSPRAQQLQYLSGQSVVPFFEGWEANPDGSFDMVFGYLNRNFREELNIPVGPNNHIEPATLDQPQPTYFYPRRHRFLVRVRVPKDWGKKDVVWTITSNGKTEKAYGYLVPEQAISDQVISENRGSGSQEQERPKVAIQGPAKLTVKAGQPLTLSVKATDDGIPARRKTPPEVSPSDRRGVGVDVDGSGRQIVALGRFARRNAPGLRVAWLQWRGPGKVTFDPWYMEGIDDHWPDFVPPELGPGGLATTTARFSEPGTYVVRALADDGGLFDTVDFTVDVTGAAK